MQRDGGPGGAGGAGNPVGGTFTGPAQALELVGDHCYAYNKATLANNSVAQFDFETGNYYAVVTYNFGFRSVQISDGSTLGFRLKMGGLEVFRFSTLVDQGGGKDLAEFAQQWTFVFPSYTQIVLEAVTTDAGCDTWGVISGRIYRG